MKCKIINLYKMYEQQIRYGILVLIAMSFAVTRLWQLDTLPFGMHVDEAGMAYDAWCLANYGVDRWLKSWPIYLENFGTGQSSLYAFLCAGLFKVFGYSIWLVRLPAVIFSLLNLIFGIRLARKIYPDQLYLSWIMGGLLTLCPYFIMSSRFGLDCNLMLGASTVFLYFMVTAIESGRKRYYIISGVVGGILLYTYALTYIILPCFLLLCLIYVIAVHKFSLKKWIMMAVPMGILAFPLILEQIINYFDLPEMKLGIFTVTKMIEYRASEIGAFRWSQFVTAVKSVFVGDNHLFDSIPGIWNLYGITVVLFVIGFVGALVRLVQTLKKREFLFIALPLLWFLVILIFESHMEANTYRINGIFTVTALLAVEGIYVLRKHVSKIFPLLLVGILGIYALCFLRFGVFYYSGNYTENTYLLEYFGIPFEEGVEFIENNDALRQKKTFVSERGIFYAVSSRISPYEFGIAGDMSGPWNNYWFGSLQEISDDYNYLVRDGFEDYCESLRQAGFTEKEFDDYSIFYKE